MASNESDPLASDAVHPSPPPPRRRRVIRIARRVLVWLFLGLLVNVAVAMAIAGYSNPTTGTLASASATSGDDSWCVIRYETAGAIVVLSEFNATGAGSRSWSASQVLGPPNTISVGDIGTAWAQSTQDGQEEWLELTYAQAVVPRSVKVYETYNQGGLTKVIAYKPDTGEPVTAWEGTDPSPSSPTAIGISEVPLSVNFPVKRIRIVIDSVRVAGWNEIDAVGLVDRGGAVQWAMKVRASSVYGQSAPPTRGSPGSGPEGLLPRWGDLHAEPEDPYTHIIGAYGWPLPSLWGSWRGPPSLGGVTTAATGTTPYTTSLTPLSGFAPPPAPGPATPSQLPARIAMPYHPVWPGLAVNSAVYAVPVALLHLLLLSVPRFLIEVSRVRRGACIRCGYDLQYDFIHGCSECGWRRDHGAITPVTLVGSNGNGAATEAQSHRGHLPVQRPEVSSQESESLADSNGLGDSPRNRFKVPTPDI